MIAFLLVVVALVTAGCAVRSPSSTGERASRPAAVSASACSGPGGALTQSMDGRVSGCLQLGPLRAGPHTVVLEEAVNLPAAKPPLKATPRTPPWVRRLSAPPEPRVALTVSPASGAAGTAITITGRLSGRRPRGTLYPNFCWDGCRFGLLYQGVAIHWTSSRTFRARLIVPAAPWIEGDPARVAPLASGTYTIGLQCLVSAKGCGSERVEGLAEFRLRVTAPLSWCRKPSSCARLQVTPRRAAPGDVVSVSGFAPLGWINGSDQPLTNQFDVLDGRPHGPEVRFDKLGDLLVGRAALEVRAPPNFADLGSTVPIAEVSAGQSPISVRPGARSTVAWCAQGAVEVLHRGAHTRIPTAAAGSTLTRMGLARLGQSACAAAVLAGSRSHPAAVVVAAFYTALAKYGAPPVYEVALTTRDGGRSWTALPVPPGASVLSFGGFRYRGGHVEAVFASALPNRKAPAYPNLDPGKPLAELSGRAGVDWRPVRLGCPARGPCVTLGAYLAPACAMYPGTQPLLRSTNGGITWSSPSLPDQVQTCAEAQLIATSARSALLIDSMSRFPLQGTTDGGASWHDIQLPSAPGQPSYGLGVGPDAGADGITSLPSGDLLLTGYGRGWELLRPGSHTWCAVHTPSRTTQALAQVSPMTVGGSKLWWLAENHNGSPRIREVALSAVSC